MIHYAENVWGLCVDLAICEEVESSAEKLACRNKRAEGRHWVGEQC